MSTLIVWTFDAPEGAVTGLRAVERLETLGRLRLADSAVVEWRPDGARPQAYQVGSASRTTMLSGAFWGLLFSAVFLLPLIGFSSSVQWAGAALARIGLSTALLRELQEHVVPGTSALFLLVEDRHVEVVRSAHDGLRASSAQSSTVVINAFTAAEEAALRHAFGDV